jgi:hypothetical protein
VHGSHMFLSDRRRRPRSASDQRLQCYQPAMIAVPGIPSQLAPRFVVSTALRCLFDEFDLQGHSAGRFHRLDSEHVEPLE